MANLSAWKMAVAVFALCAATAVAAHAQVFTTLITFDGTNGALPFSMSFVQGADGNFYGTTGEGGSDKCGSGQGCGTVFEIDRTGNLTTTHVFCTRPNCTDGANPIGGLVLATDGNFYGATDIGGTNNDSGTIFKMAPTGKLTTIQSFNYTDGANPQATLMQATDGNFYGTTPIGGAYDSGTVFRITPQGILTALYSFCAESDCVDGQAPYSTLVQATDGNLYGTTSTGGTGVLGTVFRITLGGKLSTLHSFSRIDGALPSSGLIQATDGNLYGTTLEGGAYNEGTVFKIARGGKLTTIYSFCAQTNCADGSQPFAGVVQATDGNFYGTTNVGGDQNTGTVFQITPSGALTILHDLDGTGGTNPRGGLFQATDGTFYGVTQTGGDLTCLAPYGCGSVFSLDMGLGPFVTFVRDAGRVGHFGGILGQGFTGTTSVSLNGTPATFTVKSDTLIEATVPAGATTGYVTVTTPTGVLTSNVPFHVIP